jgi:branched-chain amino acid transport system permease protein
MASPSRRRWVQAVDSAVEAWRGAPDRVRGAVLPVVAVLVALTYPLFYGSLPTDLPVIERFPGVDTGVVMIVFTMMAVGLNVVVGYAGLLDLGYVAFYATGAYVAAWLASQQFSQVTAHVGSSGIRPELSGIHISIWLVLLIAGLFTGVIGILIGLPTLRLRGDYLAIVTLGFGEIIPQFVLNGDNVGGFDLTNGTFGITPIDAPGFGHTLNNAVGLPESYRTSIHSERLFFWTALVLLLLTVFCSVRLRDSRLGRAWIAIREDETAAAAMGIPLMRTKTWSYAIGAFFGGIAGAYYASFKSGAFPSEFFFNISIFILCMVILGGLGSVWGAIVGGMVLTWLNQEGLANIGDWFSSTSGLNVDVPKYQFGIYGVIIVVVMLFRPTGLIAEQRHKRELEEGVHDEPLYEATHT